MAAGKQQGVAWTWALGAAAFVLALAPTPGTMTRVALAYLVSSIVVVAAMAVALGIYKHPAAPVPSPPRGTAGVANTPWPEQPPSRRDGRDGIPT